MPPAKKPQAPNKTLAKLLADLEQLVKDQKALNRKIAAINKRYVKVDPSKDPKTAKKIEKLSTELHYLNEEADRFSATAVGDPWQFVEDKIRLALSTTDEDELEQIYQELGHDDDFSQQDLDDWIQLGNFRTEGLMSYRQEQWVAVTQLRYQEMMDKLNIEPPYPDASLDAYW